MVQRATLICALALAAGPCIAGDSLESLFRENSSELTLEDGRLSGPAMGFLLAETADTVEASETLTRLVFNFDAALLIGGLSKGGKL